MSIEMPPLWLPTDSAPAPDQFTVPWFTSSRPLSVLVPLPEMLRVAPVPTVNVDAATVPDKVPPDQFMVEPLFSVITPTPPKVPEDMFTTVPASWTCRPVEVPARLAVPVRLNVPPPLNTVPSAKVVELAPWANVMLLVAATRTAPECALPSIMLTLPDCTSSRPLLFMNAFVISSEPLPPLFLKVPWLSMKSPLPPP